MTEDLEKKIQQSIKLIQTTCGGKSNVELAYSGGKDSDVILQLAKESGIKFTARYKNTKKRVEFFKENPKWLKSWIRAGHEFYNGRTRDEYEMMVGMLFYKTIRELNDIQNGLFGKMDCKKLLEEKFNIKL